MRACSLPEAKYLLKLMRLHMKKRFLSSYRMVLGPIMIFKNKK